MLYWLLIHSLEYTSACRNPDPGLINNPDKAAREASKRCFPILQWEVGSDAQDELGCLAALESTECPEGPQGAEGSRYC